MAFRRKMKRGSSRRLFKKTSRPHKKNKHYMKPMRGGYRL